VTWRWDGVRCARVRAVCSASPTTESRAEGRHHVALGRGRRPVRGARSAAPGSRSVESRRPVPARSRAARALALSSRNALSLFSAAMRRGGPRGEGLSRRSRRRTTSMWSCRWQRGGRRRRPALFGFAGGGAAVLPPSARRPRAGREAPHHDGAGRRRRGRAICCVSRYRDGSRPRAGALVVTVEHCKTGLIAVTESAVRTVAHVVSSVPVMVRPSSVAPWPFGRAVRLYRTAHRHETCPGSAPGLPRPRSSAVLAASRRRLGLRGLNPASTALSRPCGRSSSGADGIVCAIVRRPNAATAASTMGTVSRVSFSNIASRCCDRRRAIVRSPSDRRRRLVEMRVT